MKMACNNILNYIFNIPKTIVINTKKEVPPRI